MEGLNWQNVHIPFAAGLNQKSDDRARQPPYLDVALDVQFDEIGGVQTRKPLQLLGSTYEDTGAGGTLTTARRIYAYGDELVLFDQEHLYSWDQAREKWLQRATYLAVKTDERAVFINDDDQFDCDRAELDGVVVFAWSTPGSAIYAAAIDKATGAVRLPPTEFANDGISSTGTRPRLVALETVFHLYWIDTSGGDNDLVCKAFTPASLTPSFNPGSATEIDSGLNSYYDVVKVPGEDAAIGAIRLNPTTSYLVFSVPADPGDAVLSTKARTCDGPIAVSCDPTGLTVQVIRANGTNIQGDLITISGLVDTAHVAKAVGTVAGGTVYQIAAAHRSVADSSEYRCYAFWHAQEDDAPTVDWTSKYNYVDTGGNLGTQANFIRKLAVASRAFDYNGRVYVHMAFASGDDSLRTFGNQLQNTFFLYRDDATLHAKMVPGRAGGFPPSKGRLPHVALTAGTTTYSWCGTERRIVETGTSQSKAYEDRGPREITLTFDSNEARRCVVLGETLYIAGGEILQFDGYRLVELGFHIYPWSLVPTEDDGTGAMDDGTYTYKTTLRSDNSKGERDRSTTATYKEVTLAGGGAQGVDIDIIVPLYVSHRHFASGDNRNPALEIWRTEKDAAEGADFFLVTSKDPADTGASTNPYVVNNPTLHTITATFSDELSDDEILDNEANPENGGILENLAPPAGTILLASDQRLFLAGIAGEPDAVRYSKQRRDGEVVSFHESLTISIPREGGRITALGFLSDTLVVFRETATYALPGDGFDNAAGGANFGPARQIPGGCGAVNHECVADTPRGLVFKSRKGWYVLNQGWSLDYIGAAVSDYDDEEPLAVHHVEAQHQVRIVTASRVLVWDYLVNQWAEWSIDDGLHAAIWQGEYAYLTAAGPKAEVGYADETLGYGIDIETTWIKPLDQQGEVMIDKLQILGEYRSSDLTHLLIEEKYNYNDATVVNSKYWPVSPTTVGGPLQCKIGLKRPRCQSFKLRIAAIKRTEVVPELGDPIITNGPPDGEALKLTGLALRVGASRDLYSRLPAAQRT